MHVDPAHPVPHPGWFCCTKPLRSKVALQMQRAGSSEWEDVTLPDEVKALVVLNLQS